jgi:two-component system OmpR family response regulator
MHPPESRILIVDDSQSVRESLGWLIEDEAGLTVVGDAPTGSEAIQQATKLEPDLVILDIELPDTDGFAVTRRLKELEKSPLVILLSVHGDAVSRQRGVDAGCDAYVEKGAGWTQLLSVLRKVIAENPRL